MLLSDNIAFLFLWNIIFKSAIYLPTVWVFELLATRPGFAQVQFKNYR